MRAAIYVRVSSVAQAAEDKVSLAEQEADCRAYCEGKGYEVVALYSDVASGATKRRADFARLLEDIRDGRIEVVVAWAIDRLSRSIYATAALMEALEGTNCRAECAREAVDLDMLALHAAVGQVELRRIRERTSMGKRGAAKAGRLPSGQAAYGYRSGSDRKPEIDPEEGAMVCRMFREYASGRSVREIASGLDADGVLPRRGGRWNYEYIGIRLRDSVYVGRGYFGKERHMRTEAGVRVEKYKREDWIEIPHPPIVDEALFATVQRRLSSRLAARARRPETREFLLRHLLRCGCCDKGFVCRSHTGDSRRYYECFSDFRLGTSCRVPHIIKASALEEAVWGHVVAWVSDPDLLDEAVRTQTASLRESGAYADLQEMRRSLKALALEEDRIIATFGRKKITERQMERQLGRLSERREYYEQRIAMLEAEAREAEQQLERVGDFKRACQEIVPRLDSLSFEERVALVRAVVDVVTIDAENNVQIDIAIYTERLPGKDDAVTNPTPTLWPEMAMRCEVPVAFRSSVSSGGIDERWPRKMPWASAACGSGRARANALPRWRRRACSAVCTRPPWPVAMVSVSSG